jgi:hypothetical protein
MGTKIYECIVFLDKTSVWWQIFVNMYAKTDKKITDNITNKVKMTIYKTIGFVIIQVELS